MATGAGKTFTARKVIGDLIAKGKRIGISSNSHKAIINLMDGVADHLTENEITGNLIKIGSNEFPLFDAASKAGLSLIRKSRRSQTIFTDMKETRKLNYAI